MGSWDHPECNLGCTPYQDVGRLSPSEQTWWEHVIFGNTYTLCTLHCLPTAHVALVADPIRRLLILLAFCPCVLPRTRPPQPPPPSRPVCWHFLPQVPQIDPHEVLVVSNKLLGVSPKERLDLCHDIIVFPQGITI